VHTTIPSLDIAFFLQNIFIYIFPFNAYEASVTYYTNLFKNEEIGKQIRRASLATQSILTLK
jgi:hypothetical protein